MPTKGDVERDQVAQAWEASKGPVLHLDRFWDRPDVDPATARVYGNDTFCLVVAQILELDLVSPPDDLLIGLDDRWLRRVVELVPLGAAASLEFPKFAKPLVPKQFAAGVFDEEVALAAETKGLDPSTLMQVSEVVEIEAEARCFVVGQSAVTAAFYEGDGDPDAVRRFVEDLTGTVELPETVVLDVGVVNGELVLIEANATWGAGLNGCDPAAVVGCLDAAVRST